MKLAKARGRKKARAEAWDKADFPRGFKRPGSNKKPWPRGRTRSHK